MYFKEEKYGGGEERTINFLEKNYSVLRKLMIYQAGGGEREIQRGRMGYIF